jgi:hypothetical protein
MLGCHHLDASWGSQTLTVYMMLTKEQEYADAGQQYYEERYRRRVGANLARRAKDLGPQLVSVVNPV